MSSEHSKCCPSCGTDKPLVEWGKTTGRSDGLRYECRACASNRSQAKIIEKRALVRAMKQAAGCTDCGQNDPDVLEYDHLPGFEKSFTIGTAISNKGMAALKAEMEKCEVVCANCHRKRTVSRHRNQRAESISNLVRRGKWDPLQGRRDFQGVFVWA